MIKLRCGNTNTYYLSGLLIDTDMPGTLPLLQRELKRHALSLRDVRYVLCTHYHPDHMGLVSTLNGMGVPLLLAEHQLPHVHYSDAIFSRQRGLSCPPIDENRAEVISCGESRRFLASLGIAGELVPTLSHSPDGIAVVLDDGACFVGDLEPYSYIGAYGGNSALEKDWENIIVHHPKVIYSGHVNDVIL